MTFAAGGDFERDLKTHTSNVVHVFSRIFGEKSEPPSLKGGVTFGITTLGPAVTSGYEYIASVSPHFAAMLDINPHISASLPEIGAAFIEPDYEKELMDAVQVRSGGDRVLRYRLAALRRTWQGLLLGIAVADLFGQVTIRYAKSLQSALAEASIAAAVFLSPF